MNNLSKKINEISELLKKRGFNEDEILQILDDCYMEKQIIKWLNERLEEYQGYYMDFEEKEDEIAMDEMDRRIDHVELIIKLMEDFPAYKKLIIKLMEDLPDYKK